MIHKALFFAGLLLLVSLLSVLAQPASASSVYRLSSFDRVSITVYGEADLSTEQLISDAGQVSIPLIGTVGVGGSLWPRRLR